MSYWSKLNILSYICQQLGTIHWFEGNLVTVSFNSTKGPKNVALNHQWKIGNSRGTKYNKNLSVYLYRVFTIPAITKTEKRITKQ